VSDQVLFYISAAPDLAQEREVLGRAVTEVPVSLGWRVVQSPIRDEPVDMAAVAAADLHLLLLGMDIRAPVGLEWAAARRAGRRPVPLLKLGVLRTPAADSFLRFIAEQAEWQPFKDGAELRRITLRLLGDHLLERAVQYALSPVELARLQGWRAELAGAATAAEEETRGGAGVSGVVLSRERYVPSEGLLIRLNKGDVQG
jgi:hypothetical protein